MSCRTHSFGMAVGILFLLTAGCLSVPEQTLCARADQAAGPGTVFMTEEEKAAQQKLLDGRLEWEEIESLVTLQSPAWLEISESLRSETAAYTGACDLFRERMQENIDAIDEKIAEIQDTKRSLRELTPGTVIDEKGTTREDAIRQQEAAEQMLKAGRQDVRYAVSSYVVPVKSMLLKEKDALEPQKKAIVAGIQNTIISFQQLTLEKDLLNSYAALLEAQQKALEKSFQLGLSSADDVKNAELGLEQACLSAQKAEQELDRLKKSLEQELGFTEGTLQEIGSVPGPDTAYFDTISKEVDLSAAFDASEELKTAKKSFSKYGTETLQNAEIRKIEASVRNGYETKYAALREAKTAYEEACIAAAEAEKQLSREEEKLKRGMISELKLREEENSCVEAKTAAELSALSYKQAIDSYRQLLVAEE